MSKEERKGTKFKSLSNPSIIKKNLTIEINETISDILDDLNGGIAYQIEDKLNLTQFISDEIKKAIFDKIMDKLSPYYSDSFFATLGCYGSDIKLRISPWWDDVWQEIELRELVEEELGYYDGTEDLVKIRDEFTLCASMVEERRKIIEEDKL